MFDHRECGAFPGLHVVFDFVHECADVINPTSLIFHQVLRIAWIRNGAKIKSFPFVAHLHDKTVVHQAEIHMNLFAWIKLIAMLDGIGDRLTCGDCQPISVILAEIGALQHLLDELMGSVHEVEGTVKGDM